VQQLNPRHSTGPGIGNQHIVLSFRQGKSSSFELEFSAETCLKMLSLATPMSRRDPTTSLELTYESIIALPEFVNGRVIIFARPWLCVKTKD